MQIKISNEIVSQILNTELRQDGGGDSSHGKVPLRYWINKIVVPYAAYLAVSTIKKELLKQISE